ncbi:penicillin acylase family protein [Rhodococcus aerolatus]
MHTSWGRRAATLLTALAVAAGLAGTTPAQAAPPTSPYAAAGDYCLGQCHDILPPGENGSATLLQIIGNKLVDYRPPHTDDQLGPYDALLTSYGGLTEDQLGRFFNDASFGVAPDQVASSVSPRPDVTIVRDKATGVPHVTGTTREGTEFGAGYAAGQDRLWLMDVLRHAGRADLTSFAGGAAGNRSMEQDQWSKAPYTEDELAAQVQAVRGLGARGEQAYQDVLAYVAGINAWIARAKGVLTQPGEYLLTGNANGLTGEGIADFTPNDVVAIASLVGGIFGAGGGMELQSALVRQAAQAQYGVEQGDALWRSLRSQNDAEAVTTVHDGTSFPYGQAPADTSGVALPDPGTLTPQPLVTNPTGSATTAQTQATGVLPDGLLRDPTHGMSNALLVSGAHTDDGHPVAVFGPQTGYYAPQLLMLQELQGPGISSRGAAFAGVSFYTLLGRGQDYSWSATSAGQDITDTYALTLCNPSGGAVDPQSLFYDYHGSCTPMEALTRSNTWSPTLADDTPAGSYDLVTYRTKYGLVSSRATVGGVPVAFAKLRSTYFHEADSIIGFQELNDPAFVQSAADFQRAASDIGYAFNWFYADSRSTAYYNSGTNPVRSSTMDPNLPARARPDQEWVGYDPTTNRSAVTPFDAHPQSVDQDYYISWNNKQAPAYSAADGNFAYGAVHRGDLLDQRVSALVARGGVSAVELTQAMESAAEADLRGQQVLPELLDVIGSAPVADPAQAGAVATLRSWLADGAGRHPTAAGSRTNADADALTLMDAWWPLVTQAVLGGGPDGISAGLRTALAATLPVDQSPSGVKHRGSAFQQGWWGYLDKDLRRVLGRPVADPLPRTFCGGGDPAACRQVLLDSLGAAAATPLTTTYPGDSYCAAGDQWCADSIVQSPFGGVSDPQISWQNRPTYQQVVQYPAHRGDDVANLALGRPATASSSQRPVLGLGPDLPAGNATDGDLRTRWASGRWADGESITVDLGSAQTVARAVLRWEYAYGRSFDVQVSDDGTTSRTVAAVRDGQPGTVSVGFDPTTARYVRMQGVARGTPFGYSLHELEIYAR